MSRLRRRGVTCTPVVPDVSTRRSSLQSPLLRPLLNPLQALRPTNSLQLSQTTTPASTSTSSKLTADTVAWVLTVCEDRVRTRSGHALSSSPPASQNNQQLCRYNGYLAQVHLNVDLEGNRRPLLPELSLSFDISHSSIISNNLISISPYLQATGFSDPDPNPCRTELGEYPVPPVGMLRCLRAERGMQTVHTCLNSAQIQHNR